MKKFLCYDTNDAASGKINVSTNGVLKPNSTVPSTNGASYQQLVTDGSGNVKWEDRLAYGGEETITWDGNIEGLACIELAPDYTFYKVSDLYFDRDLLESFSYTTSSNLTSSGGKDETVAMAESVWGDNGTCIMVATEPCTLSGVVIPESGLYVMGGSAYVNKLTISFGKKIDEKFLPDNRFVVTFTRSKDGNIASDKTFAEISTAIEGGLYVYGLVIAEATTFDATPVTPVYVLQMNQYVLGQGVVFIGLSASPSALAVSSLSMDADNNISINELTLLSGK